MKRTKTVKSNRNTHKLPCIEKENRPKKVKSLVNSMRNNSKDGGGKGSKSGGVSEGTGGEGRGGVDKGKKRQPKQKGAGAHTVTEARW